MKMETGTVYTTTSGKVTAKLDNALYHEVYYIIREVDHEISGAQASAASLIISKHPELIAEILAGVGISRMTIQQEKS